MFRTSPSPPLSGKKNDEYEKKKNYEIEILYTKKRKFGRKKYSGSFNSVAFGEKGPLNGFQLPKSSEILEIKSHSCLVMERRGEEGKVKRLRKSYFFATMLSWRHKRLSRVENYSQSQAAFLIERSNFTFSFICIWKLNSEYEFRYLRIIWTSFRT